MYTSVFAKLIFHLFRVNCSFYFKIGACRHGERCSRLHNKPTFSQVRTFSWNLFVFVWIRMKLCNVCVCLRVDFHCRVIFTYVYIHVNFTHVNKIETWLSELS